MRKFRFFTERTNLRIGSSVKLNTEESEHARKSLRLKNGDEVYIFNGEKEFRAEITHIRNDLLMVQLTEEVKQIDFEQKTEIYLLQALTKKNSFEFVLEKATELGADKIVPVSTEYSVIDTAKIEKKYDRWGKIIINAAKQSERIVKPEVLPFISFREISQFLIANSIEDTFVFEVPSKLEKSITSNDLISSYQLKNLKKIAILIGPEGGFSPGEIEEMKNYQFVTLFDTVLKSETAAVSALAVVNLLLGNQS